MLLNIIAATSVVSLLSLVSVIGLASVPSFLKKITMSLVALSAGSLMGAAFFHLLPEAIEHLSEITPELPYMPYVMLMMAYVAFFMVEKWLHWQHCHDADCEVHTFGFLNLLGDGLHNFLDGIIIASAFAADTSLGIAATLAIIAHEIPQEISDFGVLIHSGFSRQRAVLANFLVALTSILGGLVGYFLVGVVQNVTPFLVATAAGGFLYIASSDLMPELRKESNPWKTLLSIALFCVGLGMMLLLTSVEAAH